SSRGCWEERSSNEDGRALMAGVTLEQVNKIYPPSVTAVEPLDLEIADGEFVVLVGPSGCGKTTLLRMIAGLEAVTAGRVLVGGRDVTPLAPHARDIATRVHSSP